MGNIKIYSVSDRYINYLREDKRLRGVFDNKLSSRTHMRKYLGAVFAHNEFNYFIPFSSPKNSDYIISEGGGLIIRKSIIPIIRMVTKDTESGQLELKGTLKLSNMIPVPASELTPYIISCETDVNYRLIVEKEWEFIRGNMSLIIKNAKVLYNQKTKCDTLFHNRRMPGYLVNTIDFLYAEAKCKEFQVAFLDT